MMSQVYSILQRIITACSGWFTQIMEATGAGDFYLAMVFIALSVGFLLSNFKVAMYVGSDRASQGNASRRNSKSYKHVLPPDYNPQLRLESGKRGRYRR